MKVMVVEDQWFWADAVVHQLAQMPGMRVAGVARDAAEAFELARSARPDIALVDLVLGRDSGLALARTLRIRHPEMRIVIVTAEPSPWTVAAAREGGISGFVSKDDLTSAEDLRQLVESLALGGIVFSPTAIALEAPGGPAAALGLDRSEIEIIHLMARGLENADIAESMSIAVQTVRNKTAAIGAKLGVSGRLAIVVAAQRIGLIAGAPAAEHAETAAGEASPPSGEI